MDDGLNECAYGLWDSPLSAVTASSSSVRFGMVCYYGGCLYWSETRADEGGRSVLMRLDLSTGGVRELSGARESVGSRVHEYGGGDFLVCGGGIFFSNRHDNGIYAVVGDDVVLSRGVCIEADWRFSDFIFDGGRDRLISVGERHDSGVDDGGGEGAGHFPLNALVGISLSGGESSAPEILVEGSDFYSNPRLSPDGRHLLWIEWDLPHMPWEGSRLMVGDMGISGRVENVRCLMDGAGVYVFQPEWRDDGHILCISNRGSDFGQFYEISVHDMRARRLCVIDAELGRPQWVFGMRVWACLGDGRIAVSGLANGLYCLFVFDGKGGDVEMADIGYCSVEGLCAGDGTESETLFGLFSHDTDFGGIGYFSLSKTLNENGVQLVRRASTLSLPPNAVSVPELLHIPADHDADEGHDLPVYALYYPPQNGSFTGLAGERPPMIVSVHGGPTGFADRGLRMKVQYWTSRGFAFLDVDYAGSWGYGGAFCERLRGCWGVRDCADVVRACDYVVGRGLADGARLLISGSSAGGYTVLCCLCLYDVFAGGASYYGIGDLGLLAQTTHKFEAGYLHHLVGDDSVFESRSPLYMADRITAPVIFFQGLDDAVVPPSQSRSMADALHVQGIAVSLHEFAGEGHGFRRGATIASCLELEYAFYKKILGLEESD